MAWDFATDPEFQEQLDWAREFVEREYEGDFGRVPVERIFISEAARTGIGTYAPHDPTTADIADLVGSVDLAARKRLKSSNGWIRMS